MLADSRHTLIVAVLLIVTPVFGVTWYAKPTPTGTGDCSSWANACSLNQAVGAATGTAGSPGDVWAKKGTYQLSEALRLKNNVRIIGGFNGVETLASQSKPFVNLTILHGGGGQDLDECNQAPLPMVYSKGNDPTAVLRGFVLEDGYAPGDWEIWCSGGALLIIDGSPTIVNCTFRDNFGWVGGAVAAYGPTSQPSFNNCTFYDNGRYLSGTDPKTGEPLYQHNYAGGALAAWEAVITLNNCLFYENYSYQGGAVYIHPDCDWAFIKSCTITANWARSGLGSGVSASGSTEFSNQNYRDIHNSIIHGNYLQDMEGPRLQVWCSDVSGSGWSWAWGLIDADPLFVDPAGGDYRLKYSSPCRHTGYGFGPPDQGDQDWDGNTSEAVPVDLALKKRWVQSQLDMGAYEVSCAAPPVLDCNGNSIPDACDVAEGAAADCNVNGVPDDCDVAGDATLDCYNANGIPDSCEAVAKGACCLTSGCQAQQTVCRCTALSGTWQAGSCATACGGGE